MCIYVAIHAEFRYVDIFGLLCGVVGIVFSIKGFIDRDT